MKIFSIFLPTLLLVVILAGCGRSSGGIDPEVHRKEIEQWKQTRLARLTRDDGWLTLSGLYWLKQGDNRVGGDSSNTVVLPPARAPRSVGTIIVRDSLIQFQSERNVNVKEKDSVITSISMRSDADENPTVLSIGQISFYVIKRGDQYAVRVKDKENPARVNFKGLEYFPVDPKWRIEAKFEPYTPPKILEVPNQVGKVDKDSCPGALTFEIDGKPYRIDVVIEQGSENQFFIMFTDETNGSETYAVGRQLYTALPDSNRMVILDFNKAYNWPCVFTEFATCPIPPRQNHIAVRIEAGEKMYKGHTES